MSSPPHGFPSPTQLSQFHVAFPLGMVPPPTTVRHSARVSLYFYHTRGPCCSIAACCIQSWKQTMLSAANSSSWQHTGFHALSKYKGLPTLFWHCYGKLACRHLAYYSTTVMYCQYETFIPERPLGSGKKPEWADAVKPIHSTILWARNYFCRPSLQSYTYEGQSICSHVW